MGFVTHIFTPDVRDRYLKLKNDLADADTYIVAEEGTAIPKDFLAETFFFQFKKLSEGVPRILGDSLIPGNCHLTMLAFSRSHPGYDFYWQVEYDVVFQGSWNTLFATWNDDTSDLVAAHLRAEHQEPGWQWWKSIATPGKSSSVPRTRAFLPIYRISRKGLEALECRVQQGWSGHFEGLIPTALRDASLTLSDLGENRFYTSSGSRTGILNHGTHRAWPTHFLPLWGRDLIYHPVKPLAQRKSTRPTLLQILGLLRLRPWGFVRETVWTIFVELRSRWTQTKN